ncbi:MAG: VIT1/CCC1 transporter family protein, partial [Acidimicrobiia bacterium]|nr:VIT1/CCC1 transporter family protein [Acidimicrobiia bacterium]
MQLFVRPGRIGHESIREIVFGVEDGVVQNLTLIAGMVGGGLSTTLIVFAAAINGLAGVLSMSMGTYLSSKAERDVAAADALRPPGVETAPGRDAGVM